MDAKADVEFVATGIEGMIFGFSPFLTFIMKASTSLATIKRNKRSLEVKLDFNCSSPDNGPRPIVARGTPVEEGAELGTGDSAVEVVVMKLGLRDRKFADSDSGVGVVRLKVSQDTIMGIYVTHPSGYVSSSTEWFCSIPLDPFLTPSAVPLLSSCLTSASTWSRLMVIAGVSKLTSDISVFARDMIEWRYKEIVD